MATIRVPGFRCDRCSYEWVPRKPGTTPVICPRCKSAYWNRGPAKTRRLTSVTRARRITQPLPAVTENKDV